MLSIVDLSKEYDSFRAVDSVSFTVGNGEIVGLLGPNGSGKTSIINMILGLLEPTSGKVLIFNRQFPKYRCEILQNVNFAAAYAQLPGNLTVKQNLRVFAAIYNVPNPNKMVSSLISRFELQDLAHKKTGLLSSGEQARLLLAKTMINSPKLILLDEPTASLDPLASAVVGNYMKKYVAETEASILWTSHDMYEIEEVCDRIIFIKQGKIVLEGRPKELLRQNNKKNLEELFISITTRGTR